MCTIFLVSAVLVVLHAICKDARSSLLASTCSERRGQLPPVGEEKSLRSKYMIDEIIPEQLQNVKLPVLDDVLQELSILDKRGVFHANQVFDTLTFTRLKGMDLRLMNFNSDEIATILSRIAELSNVSPRKITTVHPDMKRRHSLKYGRMFLDRGVESFEVFRADFGAEIPLGTHKLVLATPSDACNLEGVRMEGSFVVVGRGNCSFREKAYNVVATGAAAMIVVNTEDTLFHMAASLGIATDEDSYDWGPEGLSCLMMSHRHSISLKWAIKQGLAMASLVPFVCGQHKFEKANCVPALEDEREWGQKAISGRLSSKEDPLLSFEFFSSTFGSILPEDATLVISDPMNACGPTNVAVSAGAAILVSRGGCSFGEKVARVQEAGGHLVVVANNDESLEPIGVSLQLHGELFIPAVLLTHEAGQMLASAVSSRNGTLLIHIDIDNSVSEVWQGTQKQFSDPK